MATDSEILSLLCLATTTQEDFCVCVCVCVYARAIMLLCISRPMYIYKLLCKLAPEPVNPMVVLDASTPKVFSIYYLKSVSIVFLISLFNLNYYAKTKL